MKRKLPIVAVLLLLTQQAYSQAKEFETREQLWLAYFNQTRFTQRSGVWVDLHLRLTNDFIKNAGITIARFGYTYYLKDQVKLTSGYAYITQYDANGLDVPEHRVWQQIQWLEKKEGLYLMQYFRVEERNRRKVSGGQLTDDYSFNWRFRYNFSVTLPLKGKILEPKTPFLFFNDELHINAGKNIINNYFDQNRLFAGVGYQFTPQLNAQLGYLYVFQQLPEGNKYVNTHAVRLFVFHNLDFKNRE